MKRLVALYRRLGTRGPAAPLEHLLYLALWPLGRLYGLLSLLRVRLYSWGMLRSYRAGVPVISVGNLSVGGTGKTPMTEWLLRSLQERGLKVAIVSRGYGGEVKAGVRVVCAGTGPLLPPEISGDEPYLLARRNPNSIIIAAALRRDGVKAAVEKFGADVVLLDDGFQHLAVERDLDIVLLDSRAPFGNGQVLPAGILREPASALDRGDLVILTRCQGKVPTIPFPGPICASQHCLAEHAMGLDDNSISFKSLRGKKGIAFAGIADPAAFFAELREQGLDLIHTLAFPDHFEYSASAKEALQSLCGDGDYLITTEKDGVKLLGVDFPVPCYQVPMQIQIVDPTPLTKALETLLSGGKSMAVNEELLKILACPQCKAPVRHEQSQDLLVCDQCRLAYPIRDGIPVMLVDEAQSVAG